MTATAAPGRRLRPAEADTALDTAWRKRQWRLRQAHDDWGLHGAAGDPRASIHRAAGVVRLRRQAARDAVRDYRRRIGDAGAQSPGPASARQMVAEAVRTYRAAVAMLAEAVADFERRNGDVIRSAGEAGRLGDELPGLTATDAITPRPELV